MNQLIGRKTILLFGYKMCVTLTQADVHQTQSFTYNCLKLFFVVRTQLYTYCTYAHLFYLKYRTQTTLVHIRSHIQNYFFLSFIMIRKGFKPKDKRCLKIKWFSWMSYNIKLTGTRAFFILLVITFSIF